MSDETKEARKQRLNDLADSYLEKYQGSQIAETIAEYLRRLADNKM